MLNTKTLSTVFPSSFPPPFPSFAVLKGKSFQSYFQKHHHYGDRNSIHHWITQFPSILGTKDLVTEADAT